MSRVAIVTDSASDLPPDVAGAAGITVVPLIVSFGAETFRPGVNLTTDEFWTRMTAPDAPFPTTAAAAPGDFLTAFQAGVRRRRRRGRVRLASRATCRGRSSRPWSPRDQLPDREIRVVDSRSASMGHGMLAQIAAEIAAAGRLRPARSPGVVEHARTDLRIFIALDTLEYLKRGGRISGARAAVGTMLSIKPIISVENGDRRERGARPDARQGARADASSC